MISLDGVELPEDLWWSDEFDWQPYEQEVLHLRDGVSMFREIPAGPRPMTLSGEVWITRGDLIALHPEIMTPSGHVLQLHDGRSLNVRWRYPDPIQGATQVRDRAFGAWVADPDDTEPYLIQAVRFWIES